MSYPSSKEIKQQFLLFFADKGHNIVPSAPIVIKNDPTLMFTNAGMNQFKDYFLGNAQAPYTRAVDTQKCLRVSGKHNDLEEVGHDHYHHTMFEMLGNWSFGGGNGNIPSYFKKDAIAWAWELLTKVYKLDPNRLYVTVFEGSADDGLEADDDARNYWKEWIDPSRILNGNKKDNFWEMGDTGPCGPCSEIHFDGRTDVERAEVDGATLVNNDHPNVIEIWNNVFMEFNRKADKSLEKLPNKHVDTGMGFERLVRVIQQKNSNYDTDVFSYIIEKTQSLCKVKYGDQEKSDIAFRVIADHIRAISLCIADGQLPSNTGAGYVVRRILRRAVRYGYSYLQIGSAFLFELVNEVADYFSDVFPELLAQKEFVSKVIKEEENSFYRTLSTGIEKINMYFEKNIGNNLDGNTAFELYDTYGFPIDLTELICKEKNITVDLNTFNELLNQQKNRSKADAEKETGDWIIVNENCAETFCGYDVTDINTRISRYRKTKVKDKIQYQIVLDNCPFYAESGGQVGDTGFLVLADNVKLEIIDCIKENKLHVLIAENIGELKGNITAKVDAQKRSKISGNHSATHLMHSALGLVLGNHIAQKGSLVNEQYLRFDFNHFSKTSDAELENIEAIVNQKIGEGIALQELRNVPVDEAKAMGAKALFGEKYGDAVRIIIFNKNYSMELCGGTHVNNTSEIGGFKIISESSVSAGVRRIEAITGAGILQLLNQNIKTINNIKDLLNHPKDVEQSVQKIIDENKQLQQKITMFEQQQAATIKTDLLQKIVQKNNLNTLVAKVELDAAAVKTLCFEMEKELGNAFFVIAHSHENKPGIAVMLSENIVQEKNLDAAKIVRELAKEIQGGGGGQKFFATAGGKDISGLARVLEIAEKMVN